MSRWVGAMRRGYISFCSIIFFTATKGLPSKISVHKSSFEASLPGPPSHQMFSEPQQHGYFGGDIAEFYLVVSIYVKVSYRII